MNWADSVNGTFELVASAAIIGHCLRLYKDKMVRGVSLTATAFFTSWGFWNLYYYPSLGQILSFAAGVGVVLANISWLGMMIYYSRKK